MGEDRPVRTRVDSRNIFPCRIELVFMDEEGIEFNSLVKRTTYAGGETIIKQWATKSASKAVRGLQLGCFSRGQKCLQKRIKRAL